MNKDEETIPNDDAPIWNYVDHDGESEEG